jgi:hypothetical protein
MERKTIVKKQKELSPQTTDYVNACDMLLDLVKQDIREEAIREEDTTPLADTFFVNGVVSINGFLWPKLLRVARMIKDYNYQNASQEVHLHLLIEEVIRLLTYRVIHKPDPIQYLDDDQREAIKITTLTEMPALAIDASKMRPTPPTVSLSPEQREDTQGEDTQTTNSTPLLKALANNSEQTEARPPVKTKKGDTA